MKEYPKCPHCNVYLEEVDNYDTEIGAGDVTLFIVGECPLCEKRFQWTETYRYVSYDDFEEMKD